MTVLDNSIRKTKKRHPYYIKVRMALLFTRRKLKFVQEVFY